jgi:hypothetical protein
MRKDEIKKIFEEIDRNLKQDIKFCKSGNFHNNMDYVKAGYDWLVRQRILLRKLANKYGVVLKK